MDLEPGTLIAKRFRLERKLGEGGMGEVWQVTHSVTGRSHALKLLKAGNPMAQQRLVREARAASAVNHPHVMRIEDVFELDDGMPVLVLELLEGESLAARLERETKLSVADMAAVLLPVVSAVGAFHAVGVVHRDLKPDNIFLSDGGVKVVDFGIAKVDLTTALASEEGALTKTGALMGTPFYMSPEQASGEPVDHRTDIWSLGMVMYQLLTGVLPTQANTVGAALKIVMTGRIAPIASHAIDLDDDIVALVGRMLALHPADRPTDLHEVRDVLARHTEVSVPDFGPPSGATEPATSAVSGDVDLATGEWLAEHGPRPSDDTTLEPAAAVEPRPHHHPTAAKSAGGTTATATVTELAPHQTPRRSRWRATVAVLVAAGVAALANAQRSDEPSPATLTPTTAEPGTTAQSKAPSASPLIEPKLGLDTLAKYHSHLQQQGAVLSSASWWTTAAADFRAAAAQDGAPIRWKAAEHFSMGHVWIRKGKQDLAAAAFKAATALEPSWAEPYAGLSSALLADDQFDAALAAAQTAQRLDPTWWRGVVCGARVLNKQKQTDEAIQEYRRALSLVPDSALVLSELALTYHAARLDSEAARHGELALAIDPDMAAVRLMFAERALEKNDAKQALEQATRAVAISPRDVGARLALGDALALDGQKEEARAAYQSMIALLRDGKVPEGVPEARVALVAKLLPLGKMPPPRVAKTEPHLAPRTSKSKEVPLPPPRTNSRSSAPSTEEMYD